MANTDPSAAEQAIINDVWDQSKHLLRVGTEAGGGGPSVATQTSVASSASSVTILAANLNRQGAMVYNDSTAILYLLLGVGTASTTNYSVQLASQGFFETPFSFNGQLTGIWASANGSARVTETT
jgi:hypothetical protein